MDSQNFSFVFMKCTADSINKKYNQKLQSTQNNRFGSRSWKNGNRQGMTRSDVLSSCSKLALLCEANLTEFCVENKS